MPQPLRLRYSFAPHYKLHLEVSDPTILQLLKTYLQTQDSLTFCTRGKLRLLKQRIEISRIWEPVSETTVQVDSGLIDYVFRFTREIDKTLYDIDLQLDIPTVQPVALLPKWKAILRQDQQDDIRALTRFYGGLAAQHTGYGKTLIMLAIIESLLPERCLILVPTLGILQDVQQRGQEYGIDIPHYMWTSQVSILNPMGFLRAKEAAKLVAIAWLAGVQHVFTDEAHHLQAKSWSEMFTSFLPQVQRSYGFSASPDVKQGQDLSPVTMPLDMLGIHNSKVLGLSGTIRVRRRSSANITIVKVQTAITPATLGQCLRGKNWQVALDTMMGELSCAQVIQAILTRFPNLKFYIPVHKVTTGIVLYNHLVQLGVQGIFWSDKHLYPPKPEKKEQDLAFIKRHILHDTTRFLMTTSVGFEGIDIPSLAGIIPLIGTSYRMVIQPAGRSVRGGSLMYVLIYDKYNKLVIKQMKKRLAQIIQEYENITDTLTFRITA